MNGNLQKAEQIIKDDPNGDELTDENYQEVLTLLSSEIKTVMTTLKRKTA
jgi:hypothetical protein